MRSRFISPLQDCIFEVHSKVQKLSGYFHLLVYLVIYFNFDSEMVVIKMLFVITTGGKENSFNISLLQLHKLQYAILRIHTLQHFNTCVFVREDPDYPVDTEQKT
jgi:hypothetical protein